MAVIAFDLDGTLSDPFAALAQALEFALWETAGLRLDRARLAEHIGPPLSESLPLLLGSRDPTLLARTTALYRTHYLEQSFTATEIYPGIGACLDALGCAGHRLYVATHKRRDLALKVLEFSNLHGYFEGVLGAGDDFTKTELLEQIVAREGLDPSGHTRLYVVGDRRHDMEAGRHVAATCLGVLWGYGSADELAAAGADRLLSVTTEIPQQIG